MGLVDMMKKRGNKFIFGKKRISPQIYRINTDDMKIRGFENLKMFGKIIHRLKVLWINKLIKKFHAEGAKKKTQRAQRFKKSRMVFG